MSYLIDDGYTLHGLIAARPERHGRFKFTYRRARPRRVYLWRSVDRTNGDKDFDADRDLLLDHIKDFAALDGDQIPTGICGDKVKFGAFLEQVEPADIQNMVLHVLGERTTAWEGVEKNAG